jgi:hypothetical protein
MKWYGTLALRWLITASALLSLAGCGGTGEVAGKVTYKGAALRGGLVTIYDSQDGHKEGLIHRDGTFTVANIAPGPAIVCVETAPPRSPSINPNGPKVEVFGPYDAIPLHYKDKDKSGLTLDVKKGKQELELTLEGPAEGDSK